MLNNPKQIRRKKKKKPNPQKVVSEFCDVIITLVMHRTNPKSASFIFRHLQLNTAHHTFAFHL